MTGKQLLEELGKLSVEELELEVRMVSPEYPYELSLDFVEVNQAEDTDNNYHIDDQGKRLIPPPTFIWLT